MVSFLVALFPVKSNEDAEHYVNEIKGLLAAS